jgi:hypothetical protein
VPADHGFWPNHDQTRAPIAQPRQPSQAHPSRGIDAPRFDPALLVERELAAKNQILSFDGPPGSDRKHGQADKVGEQQQNDPSKCDHARIMRR